MIWEIDINDVDTLKNPVFIDVRSEGEFSEATIPGSFNLPLLNNEERIKVGTIYTQVSPSLARKEALEMISPKIPGFVKDAEELSQKGSLVVFCWRGGMRSKAFATVLDLMGFQVYRIKGGYKAYRRRILEFFEQELPLEVVVLRGNTGVGKTELLTILQQHNFPAIDLEKLANNRGSVFGAVGLGDPPSQKAFESMLFEEIQKNKSKYPYVIVECESKRIGRVTLPESFYKAMQSGTQVLLYDSLDNRVKRLVNEYVAYPDALDQISKAMNRLVKTLGNNKIQEYKELLENNNLSLFTERLLLEYYDHLYGYPNESSSLYPLSVSNENSESAARNLENFLNLRFSSEIEQDNEIKQS